VLLVRLWKEADDSIIGSVSMPLPLHSSSSLSLLSYEYNPRRIPPRTLWFLVWDELAMVLGMFVW